MLRNKFFFKPVFFLLLVLLAGFNIARAQTLTGSPYSRYGIGELMEAKFANSAGMGGIGTAFYDGAHINVQNPASYAYLSLTAFDAGAFSSWVKYSTPAVSQNKNFSSWNYLALAFPVAKKFGASFGLLPYSASGYSTVTSVKDATTGGYTYSHQGSGSLNQFYLGLAYKPIKNFSVGINASYLFGQLKQVRLVSFDNPALYNTYGETISYLGGFYLNAGVLYTAKINDNYSLILGLTGAGSTQINGTRKTLFTQETITTIKDTIGEGEVKGNINIPAYVSGGITLRRTDKWLVSAEYSGQSWSGQQMFGQVDSNLTNSSRIKAGGQYVADVSGRSGYLKQIRYRAGVQYQKSYVKINDNQVNNFSVSVGLGFPVNRSFSEINIAAEFGQRGRWAGQLVKEQYIRVLFGVTINDRWFIQRKYD